MFSQKIKIKVLRPKSRRAFEQIFKIALGQKVENSQKQNYYNILFINLIIPIIFNIEMKALKANLKDNYF